MTVCNSIHFNSLEILLDEMKQDFFIIVSILPYNSMAWTKTIEKEIRWHVYKDAMCFIVSILEFNTSQKSSSLAIYLSFHKLFGK